MNLPATGPFQPLHLVFLAVYILAFVFATRYVKGQTDPARIDRLFKIICAVQILLVLARRVTSTLAHIAADPQQYGWYSVLPDSFCTFSSLVLALAVLCGKRDNALLHFVAYLAMFGGFTSTVYPDYLYKESITSLSAVVGLVYHALDIWLVVALMATGWLVPTCKKLPYFAAGFLGMMAFGAFEVYVLGYPDAMSIRSALVSDLPVLTSWYAMGIECIVGVLVTVAIYRRSRRAGGQTHG